ncbi:oocyte zinc finger protein XlCOF6.1-like [Salvelinus fontinalis]|uniref:oocyte zinc finger protein XlCOF6.1 n=1 Tax=Salvelinus sp. IW2-2015 TaxID=2691554 RepID=UPI000CDF63C8|nr:oocyte zinc finger protein XlCOF6.1 [Salvelinus alpinus]XP_055733410.1 oocyte zinc finger protein XlCOF6.1-like [Salvelinus fontinalis]
MSKLQSLNSFLSECLTAATVEILGAVEKVVAEYQEEISRSKEENDRLRKLFGITPGIKLCTTDSQQLSLPVSEEEFPPEQKHCEQEWCPSLGQEEPGRILIKEELRTSQEEEQFQGPEGNTIEFIFSSPCVKSEWDQEAISHCSAVISDQVNSPPLDPEPPLGAYCSKLSTMSKKSHCCCDCGKVFALKADLQRHVTLARERPIECPHNSTSKLKAHVPLCHGGNPCLVCGKTFKNRAHLSQHMRIHTRDRPFSCGDCGKCFYSKGLLNVHIQTHKGEKPFSCGYCGKSFYQKGNLTQHVRTHTGEKPFSCGSCGKKFSRKTHLNRHILTHTGKKQHGCSVCGRRFTGNAYLLKHVDKVHK